MQRETACNSARICFFLLVFILMVLPLETSASDVQIIDDFNLGINSNWVNKEFSGLTRYSVVTLDGDKVLRARSEAAASALVYEKKYNLSEYPILSWRWKINEILPKGDARIKSGDDYPARIYVVFPHWNPLKTRSINYIWANKLPKGEHTPSLYTSNSVMIAAQSGMENSGRWMIERHNVLEDYRKVFGEEPPAVGAIVIMSDSDDTGDSSVGWYDDIRLEKVSVYQ